MSADCVVEVRPGGFGRGTFDEKESVVVSDEDEGTCNEEGM